MLSEKRILHLFILVSVMLMLLPSVSSYTAEPEDFEWFLKEPAPTGPPNYPPTRPTHYYEADEAQYPDWFDVGDEWGFNRAMLMEGSGFTKEGFFIHSSCMKDVAKKLGKATLQVSREEAKECFVDYKTLMNGKGRPPLRPRRSIAVVLASDSVDSPCEIPRWSRVYLKYPSEDNPYTGWYIAEDTGGHFDGMKTNDKGEQFCPIDVYGGIGKKRASGVTPGVSTQDSSTWVKVWVVPPPLPDGMMEAMHKDNLFTFISGQPASGMPPGAGGLEGVTEEPEELGWKPTHPYFKVPYSVNPSFSVTIPYDFSLYDEIPAYITRLERCKADQACIANNISEIEEENPDFDWIASYGGNVITKDKDGALEYKKWEAYCESPNQHAVNSLAEAIDTCARSSDNGCFCSYRLPIIPPEETESGGWFDSGLSSVSSLLGLQNIADSFIEDEVGWKERVFSLQKYGNSLKISMLLPGKADPQTVKDVDFKRVDSSLGSQLKQLSYSYGDPGYIDVYKDGHGNITLYKSGSAPQSNPCGLNNKVVKLCVVQNKSFLAYDQKTNKMGIQQLVLKFAYLFKKEVDEVGGFEVRDAKLSSGRVLAVWDNLEGIDLQQFNIYFADNKMKDNFDTPPAELDPEIKSNISMPEPLSVGEGALTKIIMTADSLFAPVCIVSDTTCRLAYEKDTPVEDVKEYVEIPDGIYYADSSQKYFAFISGIPDGIPYYFAITATSKDQEESPSFTVMKEPATSVDDRVPAFAEVTRASFDEAEGKVLIGIGPVTKYMDGSDMPPDESLNLVDFKVYCFNEKDSYDLFVDDKGQSTPFYIMQKPFIWAKLEKNSDQLSIPVSDFNSEKCGFPYTGTSRNENINIVVASGKKDPDKDVKVLLERSALFGPINIVAS